MKAKFTICLFFIYQISFAQFKILAEGPSFDEPTKGFCKLVMLKNGATLYFNIQKKVKQDNFQVKVYDPQHKEKADIGFTPDYDNLNLQAAFEVNGDVAVFLTSKNKDEKQLHRLLFSAVNGKLKEDVVLGILDVKKFYEVSYGKPVDYPYFVISKDSQSDNYALAIVDPGEDDKSKKIELIHYDNTNKIISRGYCTFEDNKNKVVECLDILVQGNKDVIALVREYAQKSAEGSRAYLNTLFSNKVSRIELEDLKDLDIDGLSMKFNTVTNEIIIGTAYKLKRNGDTYGAQVILLDIETKKILKSFAPSLAELNDKSKEIFGSLNRFEGLPQQVNINADGSFSILFEELSYEGTEHMTHTKLGHVAVVTYDKNGEKVSNYFIPKKQFYTNMLRPFYIADRELRGVELFYVDQFKSFIYLNGLKTSYVLFNDSKANDARSLNGGNLMLIDGVANTDAFYFPLVGNDIMPKRKYLYGEPSDAGGHNISMLQICEYNYQKNIFVTLRLQNKKEVSLIWLQPN